MFVVGKSLCSFATLSSKHPLTNSNLVGVEFELARPGTLVRVEDPPSLSNFNRSVYGLYPGFHFNRSQAQWVATRPDPQVSDWKIDFLPSAGNVSSQLQFQFNGTGIELFVSADVEYMDPEPGSLRVELKTPWTPVETAAVDVTYSPADATWTARSDPTKLAHNQWVGTVIFPTAVRTRVEKLTFLYDLPVRE